MMAEQFILVINEGTSGTPAVIDDRQTRVRGNAYGEFTPPHPGLDRVEPDPEEIWQVRKAR